MNVDYASTSTIDQFAGLEGQGSVHGSGGNSEPVRV